jgi:cytochrome P450
MSFLFTAVTFPFLTKFAPTLDNEGSSKFADTFRAVMKERREKNLPKVNDLADKLNDMLDLIDSPEYKRLGITENTVLAQAVGGFFLAAYDSIVTALTMLPYYLATNPSAEEKLLAEIDNFFSDYDAEEVELEHTSKLEYLGACITETLRLVPPFIRPERICTKDWSYKSLTIKKGLIVMLPSWPYHRNPTLFKNPETFYPERFLGDKKKELHQYGFSSFGFGPRNCVGSRLANETMKICMAFILKEFLFRVREETKIEYKPGVLFLLMYGPVYMNIEARN